MPRPRGGVCILPVAEKKKTVSETIEHSIREVEGQVKRAIEYIDTNIVPNQRPSGGAAG